MTSGAPLPKFGQLAVTFRPNYRSDLPPRCERGPEYGVRTMTRLVIDILLFSCMFAVVSGIVIAAAKVIG